MTREMRSLYFDPSGIVPGGIGRMNCGAGPYDRRFDACTVFEQRWQVPGRLPCPAPRKQRDQRCAAGIERRRSSSRLADAFTSLVSGWPM